MEKNFTFNDRIYTAILSNGAVKVRYGILELPSFADPEIFVKARKVLGLAPTPVVPFKKKDSV